MRVHTVNLEESAVLYQYRIPGTSEGSYFVKSLDVKPEQVGLSSAEYTEVYKVTLTKRTKALSSTHQENAPYWRNPEITTEGGGEQLFSREIKDNATFEKIEN